MEDLREEGAHVLLVVLFCWGVGVGGEVNTYACFGGGGQASQSGCALGRPSDWAGWGMWWREVVPQPQQRVWGAKWA